MEQREQGKQAGKCMVFPGITELFPWLEHGMHGARTGGQITQDGDLRRNQRGERKMDCEGPLMKKYRVRALSCR